MSAIRKNKRFWEDPRTYGTILLIMTIDRFGSSFLNLSPVTIVMDIEDELKVELPPANVDKLLAAISILTSDLFQTSLPDFILICNALSGEPVSFRVFDPATVSESAWGVSEGMLIYPPENPEEFFSDEIQEYLREVCKLEGFLTPPGPISVVLKNKDLEHPGYGSAFVDPSMFGFVTTSNNEKVEEVESMVISRMAELFNQLANISLENGDNKKLFQLHEISIKKLLGVNR